MEDKNYAHIEQPKVIAHLVHEPTKTVVSIYKPMNWFQRWMIKWCFGLKYVNDNYKQTT